jgi:DNA primase
VGIKNAVALCSTALTPGHLSLLTRADAKELYLLFDGDEAGRKAVERLAGPLLAAGAVSKVALLPEMEDPDTFARKNGEAGVRQLLESARTLTEHLFMEVLPRGAAASFEEKMKALDRLKPVTSQLPVGLVRSAFFASMGSHFGLPPAELERSLRGKSSAPRPSPKATPPVASHGLPTSQSAQRPTERAPEPLEAAFVACVARDVGLLSRDTYRISDQLKHPALRAFVGALGSGQRAEDVLFEASEAVKAAVENARAHLPPEEAKFTEVFLAICRKLKLRWIDEQLRYISQMAASTEGVNDLSEETRRLQSERVDLLALRRKVLQEANTPSESSPSAQLES